LPALAEAELAAKQKEQLQQLLLELKAQLARRIG
jgi:hypothetical protein